ncbi:PTS transporter subunit EIIC [Bombilactobacillus folatiphilus]|uniref:PTS transporter subunit EIIC n=1 Tax=Bombilactobacillus folatiphilus TaxID=2923362 RepID=A0ABY4PBI2_9LACO|nr:PTS transporter subunit EIIC [Bombilactobacillus folatiphilus]UQS82891.1 PTS transporter subunit EIIC [Bombilactobacillus folatiphilus]
MPKKQQEYQAIAQQILQEVGGSNNIESVTHCMTRLRFILKDNSLPDDQKISEISGVIGVRRAAGQYQVIIGQTVTQVYEQLCQLADLQQTQVIDENLDLDLATKTRPHLTFKSIGSAIMNKLAGSLTPLIPVLVAASMFKMFAAVLGPSMLNWLSATSDTYQLFVFVGDAGFYFFPILIGYTAAKQFHAQPLVAMFLGAIMVHPTLLKLVTDKKNFAIFGLHMPLVNYSATIIPIILSVWIMSYIERFLKKWIPASLSTIFVPTLTILIMLPITLCIVGPAGGFLGKYICDTIIGFGKLGGIWSILAIALIGALWELLVMTGMHLVLISAMMMVIAQNGFDNFTILGSIAASLSVAGMCLGAALRLRDKKQKALAWSYLIASFVGGVTEPALYGIAVRYKRSFWGMMIGGFCGALYAALCHVKGYVLVPVANFMSLTAYVHNDPTNLINGIISGVIAFLVAALATYLIGFDKSPKVIHELKPVEG